MATQTRERDLFIETNQGVVQTIDLCQEVRERNLGSSAVQVLSGFQKASQAILDKSDGSFSSDFTTKAFVRLLKLLTTVHNLLVAPPATERGRIRNAMAKAKHDRFIRFLR